MLQKLKECPKCGHDTFYVKEVVTSKLLRKYRFDGAPADNSKILEGMQTKPFKFASCANCFTKLGRVK